MWLHQPRRPGVVMTMLVLLGWWIMIFIYGTGGGAVYIYIG